MCPQSFKPPEEKAMSAESRFADHFLITPHPAAPLYRNISSDQAKSVLSQLVSELHSSRPSLSSPELLDVLRQTCLVNLFFCIKYVLGPFLSLDYLSFGLQLDMANIRQSPACMDPGARFGFCIFRGSGKTDILTIGGSVWEILRNPNISILIVNATQPRAAKFVNAIRTAFMINPLLSLLFPEHCNWKASSLWNTERFVSPARTRFSKEPTCAASGCTGSTEGDRADLVIGDDLIGLDDLTSENLSSANMSAKIQWFLTAEKAAMKSLKSRFLLAFTTFGAESLYSHVFQNIKESLGYPPLCSEYPPGGSRKWTVYFRDVIEYGKPTLPEVQTEESLEDLRRTNPALYYSQYRMLPQDGGQLEFRDFPLGTAELLRSRSGRFFICLSASEKFRMKQLYPAYSDPAPGKDEYFDLSDLSISCALDPAGTAKSHATTKTSRSAIEVWARDYYGRTYLLYEDCDFYDIRALFRRVEEVVRFFSGLIPSIGVEKAAMQRILRPLLERERDVLWPKDVFVSFSDVPSSGNKDAEIRFTIGPLASRGLLYVCRGTGKQFQHEYNLFCLSRQKDALDASQMAISRLYTPLSPEAAEEASEREALVLAGRDPVTGY